MSPLPSGLSRRTAAGTVCVALLATAACTSDPDDGPAAGSSSPSAAPELSSAITGVEATTTPVLVGGEPWLRITGTLSGVVDPAEEVAGLEDLPKDADGRYAYTAGFEVVTPEAATNGGVVLVEAENRGLALFLRSLQPAQPGPADLGDGALATGGLSYARVQWQTGIAAGVPEDAQGVGEVIVRDFGRMLEGATRPVGTSDIPEFGGSILAGVSQAGWFVDTFVAEGFNAGPEGGVYDAAVALDGTGNWLAINQLADGAVQTPYALQDGEPLTYDELLTRPDSDPLFVDVANYTDYYRLRASVAAGDDLPEGVVRYDWPAPHASTVAGPALVFGATNPDGGGGFGCNGGVQVPLNPVDYGPFLRTLVVRLAGVVAGDGGLPDPALFTLEDAPAGSPESFNGLPGVELQVPAVDEDSGQPVGGVRFPDAEAPLGRPTPVSLPPVEIDGLTSICGNFGGWQPFSAAELADRYGDVDGYLTEYTAALDAAVEDGYLDETERAGLLTAARTAYTAAG
ncbi:alpha/beta hydrolase domain-containing protein [Blastococcus sp. URHD0036]|uniref:alpha/beta hydrolase domain-containing protein n=1 Tax=Blastococcus sp. URHD0036 TaxID=1380356 RepID=UPI00049569B8|nr:alpha/beta hydrolase domain-containing protein [Blastococcus sp. URHD0036]